MCVLQFEDAKQLRGHLERLLYFRDQLCQRESEVQQQADQQRNALLRLEEEHQLLWMHNNNQLSQLQTELEKTYSEALTWVPHKIKVRRQIIRSNVAYRLNHHLTCVSIYRKGSGTTFSKQQQRRRSCWDRLRWRPSTSMKQ